jgi:hypothetical protein
MRSAVRQAIAWMVSDGLTPPTVGNTEPSQIHKLGISHERQSALTTLVRGSAPHTDAAVEMAGVVGLVPEFSGPAA